jgi:hypothetical protein
LSDAWVAMNGLVGIGVPDCDQPTSASGEQEIVPKLDDLYCRCRLMGRQRCQFELVWLPGLEPPPLMLLRRERTIMLFLPREAPRTSCDLLYWKSSFPNSGLVFT